MNTAVIAACQKKVTIYIGTKKYEANWIEVSRGPYAKYLDAFHFKFKPKGARNLRSFVEHYRPKTVIVDGWGHPEFDWLIRAIDEAPDVELSPGAIYRTVTQTIRPGQPMEKDKYQLEFEHYVSQLNGELLLLDTRGASVQKRF